LSFFEKTANARKILVLDLGFLGDTIHLIPALWMIKQNYPKVKLHVAVDSNVMSLLGCFPWVDKTWGYTRYPKHATLSESISFVRGIRREKYDVIINLNGSDRSGWLGLFSGASNRLGRLTSRGKRKTTDIFFTDYIDYPYDLEPIYIQRCRCLEKAGLQYTSPEFHCEVRPEFLDGTGINEKDAKQYFHISPFTTADRKELPLDVMVDLINQLNDKCKSKKIVLSCAPNDRELRKMSELLSRLSFRPWYVYSGNLNLFQLVAVIKHSILHLSGDTGPMHIAVMTETPSISWFQPTVSKDWIPQNDKNKILFGESKNFGGNVMGINSHRILQEVRLLLEHCSV
jgi:ADP-heptose:LPS heptosyltransferase